MAVLPLTPNYSSFLAPVRRFNGWQFSDLRRNGLLGVLNFANRRFD